jgi:hypothetical protein
MIKNRILYKIVDDPYTEVGPILIGNTAFSSAGLKIQFFPLNDSPWVANLLSHRMNLNAVYPLEGSKLLAVAGGAAYIINTETKEIYSKFGLGYENIIENSDGTIILSDPIRVTLINPNGEIWNSEPISMDGIKDLEIRNNVLYGLACDVSNYSRPWVPFSLDLMTKKLEGGSSI